MSVNIPSHNNKGSQKPSVYVNLSLISLQDGAPTIVVHGVMGPYKGSYKWSKDKKGTWGYNPHKWSYNLYNPTYNIL